MSSFTRFSSELSIRYDAEASRVLGTNHWRVVTPFRFYIGSVDSGRWVYIPEGYLTDGASVPSIFWSLLPPWGVYGQAAVVHDIVCEYLTITDNGLPHHISRAECDSISLEAMIALQVPATKRSVIYGAVCAYRLLARVNTPTATTQKRALEANWRSS